MAMKCRRKGSLLVLLYVFHTLVGGCESQGLGGTSVVPVSYVDDGTSAELPCSLHAVDIPDASKVSKIIENDFKWWRNGSLIHDSLDGHYLTPDVSITETYNYTCQGNWELGSTGNPTDTSRSSVMTLRVIPKRPTLTGMIYVVDEGSTSLTCTSLSVFFPEWPVYQWYRNRELVGEANSISVYTVHNARPSEKHEYTCKVTFRGVPSKLSNILTLKVRTTPDICKGTEESEPLGQNPFCKFFKKVITGDNVASVVGNLESMTAERIVTKTDATLIVDHLEYIAENVPTLTSETGQGMLFVVSNVSQQTGQPDFVNGTVTNSVIKTLDGMNSKVDLNNAPSGNIRLFTKNMMAEVMNASTMIQQGLGAPSSEDTLLGLQLRTEQNRASSTLEESNVAIINGTREPSLDDTEVAILINASLLDEIVNAHSQDDVRFSMNILTEGLFAHDSYDLTDGVADGKAMELISKVISASITVSSQPVTGLKPYGSRVKTVFLPNERLKHLSDEERFNESVCVFWDVKGLNGSGAWSDIGCAQKAEKGHVVCECDHLTHFAVLCRKQAQAHTPHDFYLGIITKAGLAFSLLGLALTILCFVVIREWRQSRLQQILVNLALSLFCAWSVFLFGFERVENRVVCKVVASLLHYFILVSFLWMLAEGLLQFWQLVKGANCYRRLFSLKVLLPAWGLPLIPVIVIMVVDDNLYLGHDSYCWMEVTAFFYAFLLPASLVLSVNLVIYVLVVIKLCRLGAQRSVRLTSRMDSKNISVRISVCSFVVLGLSWILAVVSVKEMGVVMEYLSTISTSLQGLLLFLLFTARDPRVIAFWRRKFGSVDDGRAANNKEEDFQRVRQELRVVFKEPVLVAQPSASSDSPQDTQETHL